MEPHWQRDGLHNRSPFCCTVKRAVNVSLRYNVIYVHLFRYRGKPAIQMHCGLSVTGTGSFNLTLNSK